MATMVPSSRERAADIQALTKPETLRLGRAEAKLKPFQDEKLDIYNGHIDDMSMVFEQARHCRGGLQDLYAERNKEVLDTLAGIRARTDREARRQLDKLKDFAAEFDSGVSKGRKGWRAQLAADQNATNTRCTAIDNDVDGHLQAIQTEREECLAFTQAEYGPILDKLREHRGFLERQIAEREVHHEEFCTTLQDQFGKLRKRLGREALARQKQCDASKADAEKSYADLSQKLKQHDSAMKRRLDDLKAKIEKERNGRINHHETKVRKMMQFMEDFEAHLKQQTAETTKLDFKALMQEQEY